MNVVMFTDVIVALRALRVLLVSNAQLIKLRKNYRVVCVCRDIYTDAAAICINFNSDECISNRFPNLSATISAVGLFQLGF